MERVWCGANVPGSKRDFCLSDDQGNYRRRYSGSGDEVVRSITTLSYQMTPSIGDAIVLQLPYQMTGKKREGRIPPTFQTEMVGGLYDVCGLLSEQWKEGST
jgi:hypothetical protein